MRRDLLSLFCFNRKDFDFKHDLFHFRVKPTEENLYVWNATIDGPEGTPYERGVFRFRVEFPANYPFVPPKVRNIK